MLGINNAATQLGFNTAGLKLTIGQLGKVTYPCILHWDDKHFVVLIKKTRGLLKSRESFLVADPSTGGLIKLNAAELGQHWLKSATNHVDEKGVILFLEPGQVFFDCLKSDKKKIGFRSILPYLWLHKKLFFKILIGTAIGSAIQFSFPYLTQSIVDKGISAGDLSFITIILIAQLTLTLSKTLIEFMRGRILLKISTRVNLSILMDFWIKLMKLPISFFDKKMTGDILQRIADHSRIENFLTASILNTLFSIINLIVYSIILCSYDLRIFIIFFVCSLIYYAWIHWFLQYRRRMDYQSFHLKSSSNGRVLELIQGMQEIKLNNAEQLYRQNWKHHQAAIFRLNYKKLKLTQFQQAGALFINEGKNILTTYLVAGSVISGHLTLGAMLAIQFMIGQLNAPIEQIVNFTQSGQDAKISLERLNEVHQLKDEDNAPGFSSLKATDNSIVFEDVSFSYPGSGDIKVLKNIRLTIPYQKTTAIVGMSGSGKTTFLKLLLKYYDTFSGSVKVGNLNITSINASFWRSQCGAVMQDGFIFNDSIAKNISVNQERPDKGRLIYAAKLANLLPFIDSLPQRFDTQIGNDGVGISAGQKQRILIARVIYKNPPFVFLDEATNALDANNEKLITENLAEFLSNKTVIIIAHRLSTVKNADNIVLLEHGQICEEGSHEQLTRRRKKYFELVKNQLELDRQ